jgi:hypothetical protein
METLQAIYIALAVFGVGVTIVDLFGALDHGGGHEAGGGHGHDGSHDAGHAHDIGSAHAGHDGHHGPGHEVSRAGDHQGSVLGAAKAEEDTGYRRSAAVGRAVGMLRIGVYFALGAGPTGLAALAMKLSALDSFFWAAGAGAVIAVFARLLRRFVRRDLDSSFRPEDFILEEAEITVSISPGLVGRALVRKYGAQSEVYVRAISGDRAFARGARVRIIDYQEDYYIVEAADEEHLVR